MPDINETAALRAAAPALVTLRQAIAEQPEPVPCTDPLSQEYFFSKDRHIQVVMARRCETECPVLKQCRNYALKARERFGVWGGTTEAERVGNVTRNYRRLPEIVAQEDSWARQVLMLEELQDPASELAVRQNRIRSYRAVRAARAQERLSA